MWTGVLVAVLCFQAAPSTHQDWQAQGLRALEQNNYPAAIAAFERAVSADSRSYAARFHLALSYSLAGRDAEAIGEYRKTLELKPDLYEANLNLGILLLRTKQAEGALAPLRTAASTKPKDPKPAAYLADALLDTGKLNEARETYTGALALDPNIAAAELGLARVEARSGNLPQAAQHFERAAELEPAYKEAILELAEIYESKKQLAEAAAIYARFKTNPAAQERAGEILLSTGKPAEAVPLLEFSVAKAPTSANRLALATAYFATNELEKGGKVLNEALAADPKDFALRMLAGRVLRDHKQFRQAAAQFLAASAIKPDSIDPLRELVTVLLASETYPQPADQGALQAALGALDKIKALGGETPAHFYLRAIILDKLNQDQPALEYYQRFLAASEGKFPDEEFKSRQRARIIQKRLSKR